MEHIVDQFSDHSFGVLVRAYRQHPELQDMCKTANIDPSENECRSANSFAWQERHMFPIDSPAQATVSGVYIQMQKHAGLGVPQHVQDRCNKALELYDIELPQLKKTAASEPDEDEFLLPSRRRWRVRDADDVKLASDALQQNWHKLPLLERTDASIRLAKKAAAHNVSLPSRILKMATATSCETLKARDWVEARARMSKDDGAREGYEKIAGALGNGLDVIDNREELMKLASALHELDKIAGLEEQYDRRLLNPIETVFNSEKIALNPDETMMLGGRVVPIPAMMAVPGEIYREVLGDDIADEILGPDDVPDRGALTTILPTVPRDVLSVLLEEAGV